MKRKVLLVTLLALCLSLCFVFTSCFDRKDNNGDNNSNENDNMASENSSTESIAEDDGEVVTDSSDETDDGDSDVEKKVCIEWAVGDSITYTFVEKGALIPVISTSIEGHTLVEYQCNGVKWNFDTDVATDDVVLVAVFVPNEYSIKLGDSNERVGVTYGDSFTLPIPSRFGYKFEGWENEEGVLISSNDGKSLKNYSFVTDIDVYPVWNKLSYSINYHNVDGISNKNPLSYDVDDLGLALVDVEKSGYNFLGWYTDEAFENKVVDISSDELGVIDLYAAFEAKSYLVAFDSLGGEQVESKSIVYDQNYTLEVPKYEGHTFLGWCLEDGTIVTDEKGSSLAPWNFTEGKELVAKYVVQPVITYYVDNLQSGTQYVAFGEKYKVIEDERIFVGWYDIHGNKYIDNDGAIEKEIAADIALYAKFSYTYITNAEELRAMKADGRYMLANDIDLEDAKWTPLFNSEEDGFTGELDGAGHTISNFVVGDESGTLYYFGFIGVNDGLIKNVKLSNCTVDVAQYTIAVGSLVALNKNTVLNCHSTGSVMVECDENVALVGGLIGSSDNDGKETEITNCSFKGMVVAENAWAGGIVGWGTKVQLLGCFADIELVGGENTGGIVGLTMGRIENCQSCGSVRGKECVGGIVGAFLDDMIRHCNSSANVSLSASTEYTSSSKHIGGVIGFSTGTVAFDCYSTGNVHSYADVDTLYAGGLCGTSTSVVAASWSSGEITVRVPDAYATLYVGGLCGEAYNVINSYAIGNVSVEYNNGATYCGGVCALAQNGIINSFATGDIVLHGSTYGYAGKIVAAVSETYNGSACINSYYCTEQNITNSVEGETSFAIYETGLETKRESVISKDWVGANLWVDEIELWSFDGDYPKIKPEALGITININSPDELKALQGKCLLLNYKLTNDIDLNDESWTPICMLFGSLDGDGHTLTNFVITSDDENVGLVGINCGKIVNLNVNCSVKSNEIADEINIGIFAGKSFNSIENCSGIAGVMAKTTTGNLPAFKCIKIGGVAGYAAGEIINCSFSGKLTAENCLYDCSMGGIVGSSSNCDIVSCYSNVHLNTMVSADSKYTSNMYLGGIVGNASSSCLKDCSTKIKKTELTCESEKVSVYVGGAVGYLSFGEVEGCCSEGMLSNITTAKSDTMLYCGGLAGYLGGGSVIQSYSTCSVSLNSGHRTIYAGGFAGYSKAEIKNCYSMGGVDAKNGNNVYGGGFVGYLEGSTICCYSGGYTSVEAVGTYSKVYGGGFAGYIGGTTIQCVSFGNVWVRGVGRYSKAYGGRFCGAYENSKDIKSSYANHSTYTSSFTLKGNSVEESMPENVMYTSIDGSNTFVRNTLGFSKEIWNFEGDYPMLARFIKD